MTRAEVLAAIADGQRLRREILWTIVCDRCTMRIQGSFRDARMKGWVKRWDAPLRRSGPGSGVWTQVDLCPLCVFHSKPELKSKCMKGGDP